MRVLSVFIFVITTVVREVSVVPLVSLSLTYFDFQMMSYEGKGKKKQDKMSNAKPSSRVAFCG